MCKLISFPSQERLLLSSPVTILIGLSLTRLNTVQYTIDDILSDSQLTKSSRSTQESIDTNRKILKKELGLTEEDIIDIPMLYKELPPSNTADSFFPNMVNMVVLGKLLVIPKPFGPVINGRCCIEEKVRSLLEPLGLSCNFIDDFTTYHELSGEVHCGTNVVRRPFSNKWWEMIN